MNIKKNMVVTQFKSEYRKHFFNLEEMRGSKIFGVHFVKSNQVKKALTRSSRTRSRGSVLPIHIREKGTVQEYISTK